jgi:hypothetical protein
LAAARREVAELDQRLRSAPGRLPPGVRPEGGFAT